MSKQLINEVRRFQKIAGLLKEDKFYAPDYLLQLLGSEEAVNNLIKQFEEDHISEEDPEGDNARDYLLSIDNPEELMRVVKDYVSLEEDDYTDPSDAQSGDTSAMNIDEDDFSATMHAVEDDPVV